MVFPLKTISIGKKLSNIYSVMSQPILRKFNINQTCFDVLMFCANNPECNTARDICAVRGIKSGIASVAVETLISSGYLKQTEDKSDRRKRRLSPTEKADELISCGRNMQKKFAEILSNGISAEEFTVLENVIEKIELNIGEFQKKGE